MILVTKTSDIRREERGTLSLLSLVNGRVFIELYMCVCGCVSGCVYQVAHNHAIRLWHPSHYMPLTLVLVIP